MPGPFDGGDPPDALGRRSLIAMLRVFATLTLAVVGVSRVHACVSAAPRLDSPGSPPVPTRLLEFLGPIAPGHALAGWTVAEVGPLIAGGLRVLLRDAAGESVALTVRLRDPHGAAGLTETATLTLFGAPAAAPAARALAPALAARERASPPPLDLTMGTR